MTGTLADVVQAKNLMVNETLDEVEEAPADEHPSEKRLTADCPPPFRRPSPKKQDANGDRDPGGGMEEAIGERVDLQASDSGLWVLPFAAQQVVPLEDLVEDNAVHKPPETDPDQDSWRSRTACWLSFRKGPWYLPFGHGSHPCNVAHTEEAKPADHRRKADCSCCIREGERTALKCGSLSRANGGTLARLDLGVHPCRL